ncbi:MAG: ABC transporter ATP-binding protein [Holophagales bacterium]|nr:ABC transporter ATP-binding protein [Holophagales bacterium]
MTETETITETRTEPGVDLAEAAGADAAPVVQARGLGKAYRRDSHDIEVLEGIDLDVAAGEFVALMGPSGSGKSTLLNLVAGIDQPTAGELRVGGRDISKLSDSQLARWRHRNIGFIFQFYNLLPVLTAYENVELPLTLTQLKKPMRRKKAETALGVVGLQDRMEHYPRQLSGGQEQRVAIARAIVTDPTLLLADEPTGDLDAESAGEILDLLEQLNREFGKTIVMVTHDPEAAKRARRLIRLHKGRLVDELAAGG